MKNSTFAGERIKLFYLVFVFAPILAFLFLGCASFSGWSRTPVSIDEVIQMSKINVPVNEIIQKIHKSGTVYRLKGSDYAKLKAKGVPDEVLDYLLQSYIDQIHRAEALSNWDYFYYSDHFGTTYVRPHHRP